MDRKHSSGDNDDNSEYVSLESNEIEDSNQHPHVKRSHNFRNQKIQMMKEKIAVIQRKKKNMASGHY